MSEKLHGPESVPEGKDYPKSGADVQTGETVQGDKKSHEVENADEGEDPHEKGTNA